MDWKQFYLTYDGRVSRKQYWLQLILPVWVISIVLSYVDMAMQFDEAMGSWNAELQFWPLTSIFNLVALVPSIFVAIKRLHDRDKSGWWLLIFLIPVIGILWLFVELGFLRGTDGPNRFGPPVGGGGAWVPDARLE